MSLQICVTIDDVPSICDAEAPSDDGGVPQAEYMGQVGKALRTAGVPTIFFLNSDRISADLWSPAELLDFGELGNHTASHCSIDDVSIETWAEDVRRCSAYLHSLSGRAPRWFRYPYLRTGSDDAKITAARALLNSLGLHSVPGSCAPLDWLFARYYLHALKSGDVRLCAELEHRALENILLTVADSAAEAKALCSESVPLVLVLHAGALVGRILGETLERLAAQRVEFIRWEPAMETYERLSAKDRYRGTIGPPYLLRLSERGRRDIDLRSDWLSRQERDIEQWWRETWRER